MKHYPSYHNNAGSWTVSLAQKKHLLVWVFSVCVPLAFIYLSRSPKAFLQESPNPPNPAPVLDDAPVPAIHSENFQALEQGGSAPVLANPTDISGSENPESEDGECDLSTGEWIPDKSEPLYTNQTCWFIQDHQNCIKNGRPDMGYLYWRWKPQACDLERFDPRMFLQFLRGKTLAFVGDSIGRNHMQSLLCMLSQVEIPNDIYNDGTDKFRRWYFPSYKVTIAVLWSPFFVKEITEDIAGVPSGCIKLQIDVADDKWTSQLHEFDVVLLSGGQWFPKSAVYLEKGKIIGCHYCTGTNITELGFFFAYRKALSLAFKSIYTSPSFKGLTLLRTFTPDHFENGRWDSGGTCERKVPYKANEVFLDGINKDMYKIQIEEFKKASREAAKRGLKFRLISTTRASLMRPDGHPGPYRYYYPFSQNKTAKVQNDCLHWCLPGPIDTWNEFILEMLKREFQ